MGMKRDVDMRTGDMDAGDEEGWETWSRGDPSVALHPKGDIRVLEGIARGHGGWV